MWLDGRRLRLFAELLFFAAAMEFALPSFGRKTAHELMTPASSRWSFYDFAAINKEVTCLV